jgi:galactose mutarotase-like enzyme
VTVGSALVEEVRFRGEPGMAVVAGGVRAVFLPGIGMTGVSLRFRGREHLALPGGTDALRAGHTAGLPLLAPWANRLASRRYRVGRTEVDLTGMALPIDANGVPIHGLLVGQPGWSVTATAAGRGSAHLTASRSVDSPAFPFPHRLELRVVARDAQLAVTTTLVPTTRRSVPVAFGWHPYLRLSPPRASWTLRLPARHHLLLDERGIPTGARVREAAETVLLARRTFDDLYELGRDRALGLQSPDGSSLVMRGGGGYRYAQVWVPPGRPFVALEPMTAPTNALATGEARVVRRRESFTAWFSLSF